MKIDEHVGERVDHGACVRWVGEEHQSKKRKGEEKGEEEKGDKEELATETER